MVEVTVVGSGSGTLESDLILEDFQKDKSGTKDITSPKVINKVINKLDP